MDKETAAKYLDEYYDNPSAQDIEKYLGVVAKLREICEPDQ